MLFNRSLPATALPSSITILDGHDLEYVDNYKYLGVWLDCRLTLSISNPKLNLESASYFASFTHAAKLTLVKLIILLILDFGDVIYKSLQGKAPPYLSSLVTIAAPTRSTRSSRYISLVTPKANSSFGRLSFQFSAANGWNELQKSLKLETHIFLTSFKHQLSEQLTDHCTRT
ncbi:unnamed protein product [Oncorhynchus mykiss]|uniref:Uncharacterized protein n=1 Tax=Oncorhynchus mykiss TaxID=8022 RepID=A0A060Y8C0_ONCMY|nr:unnamed protein product [Oncorhynchus mykiss]